MRYFDFDVHFFVVSKIKEINSNAFSLKITPHSSMSHHTTLRVRAIVTDDTIASNQNILNLRLTLVVYACVRRMESLIRQWPLKNVG
jgi:hypothetical protein